MGKFTTFFVWGWFIVGLLGSILQGGSGIVATRLTDDVTAVADVLPVTSTRGFTPTGIVVIGDEKIAYSVTDDTNFRDDVLNPMTRGASETTAVAHLEGAMVFVTQTSILNQSLDYSIATIADASGLWAALAIGLALMRLIGNFMTINFSFLGTDLALVGYVWIILSLGLLVSIGIALAGGRRV